METLYTFFPWVLHAISLSCIKNSPYYGELTSIWNYFVEDLLSEARIIIFTFFLHPVLSDRQKLVHLSLGLEQNHSRRHTRRWTSWLKKLPYKQNRDSIFYTTQTDCDWYNATLSTYPRYVPFPTLKIYIYFKGNNFGEFISFFR